MSLQFAHAIPKLHLVNSRYKFLQEYVKGKVVLHAGCVDSGLLDGKIGSTLLLHDVLATTSEKLIGVDVDKEGVELMIKKGYKDIYYGDLETWEYSETFDVIVLGEIIEHIDNCGAFLQSVMRLCGPNTEVLITTPNNYYFLFWVYTLFGKESIHPDHNYLFSYYSIKSLLGKFNFEVKKNIVVWEKIDFSRTTDSPLKKLLKSIPSFILNLFNLVKYIFPQYGKGIIVVAIPAKK